MVDAFDLEQVEHGFDVGRRPFLAGMGDQAQAQLAATGEDTGEFFRRMAALGRVQAHAGELVTVRACLFQCGESILFREMAQEAHDQAAGDGQFLASLLERARNPGKGHADVDPAGGVRLRIEKNLGMAHVVGTGAHEICPGHVEKVLLLLQDAGAGVINVEERLQIGERIGCAQGLYRGVGQFDAVALGQLEDQFRFERSFDVDVQLGLGHGFDQFDQGGSHRFLDVMEYHLGSGDVMAWFKRSDKLLW